jgi:hydrogenase nickel incorporation protein HypB
MKTRIVEVRTRILKNNDVVARALRQRFADAGVFVVSLVSSPGSGKTAFLRETLRRLTATHRVAALVGDLATDNDARRLARSGAPVRQITTGTVCHLEAEMVRTALDGWDLGGLDYLFVENVGNLVCPALFDLGETARVVVMSVTEGDDKPLKYPHMFRTADLVLINKADLLPYVDFDPARCAEHMSRLRPAMEVLLVSATRGTGLAEWYRWLGTRSTV